jgi:hypothetical protein
MAEEDAGVGADVELQVAHRGGVADDMQREQIFVRGA